MQSTVDKYLKLEGGVECDLVLAREVTYGATMDPKRAHMEEDPRPTLRTTVGNSSAAYRYAVGKATDIPKIPNAASVALGQSGAENKQHSLSDSL